jgi:hypothetical protein
LPHGNGGDGEIAKAVKAINRGYPNIAFTIFEEFINVIAGEAVSLRKNIRPSLMYMQEASVRGSNPESAIAIAVHTQGLEMLRRGTWKRVRLGLSVNQFCDSTLGGDQECAVVAFV